MIVAEATAFAILCALMAISTNRRQNRPDDGKVHAATDTTRAMMAGVQFLAVICVGLSIPANRFGIGLIGAPIGLNIIGLVLMTCGLLVRLHSMKVLGRRYSTLLFVNKDHALVTKGIYGIIRHPVYLGDIVLFVATGIAVANFVVLLVITVACIPAYLVRIGHEERMMIEHYGGAYLAYRKRTRKLIPFIY